MRLQRDQYRLGRRYAAAVFREKNQRRLAIADKYGNTTDLQAKQSFKLICACWSFRSAFLADALPFAGTS